MIRVLVLIAVTGFMVALISLSAAISIGGPEAISRGAWSIGRQGAWSWDGHDGGEDNRHRRVDGSGPQTTREIAWTGGDRLEIAIPADVQFVQAAGPGKVVITGAKGAVEQVEVNDGDLSFRRRVRDGGRLAIVITAPKITRFDLGGDNRLTISGYDQDRLEIDISGSAAVTAKGRAGVVDIDMSGSPDADLGELAAESVEADLSGSSKARLAPKTAIRAEISGSGDLTLLTIPPQFEVEITGAGRIHTPDGSKVAVPAPPIPGKKT